MTRSKDLRRKEPVPGDDGDAVGLFEMLYRDHDKIRDLFCAVQQTEKTHVAARKERFTVLEQELLFHMEAEERFFFTALEQREETRSEALLGFEEHLVARTLIATFTSLAVDDERWSAKFKVLGHLVGHHLEEEEQVLFVAARLVLDQEQLRRIYQKMQELKNDPRVPEGALRSTDAKDTR